MVKRLVMHSYPQSQIHYRLFLVKTLQLNLFNIAVDGKYAEESAQEMIEDLREVLEKLGITVEITEGFHDTKYLSFRYDVDEIRKKAGRNAGAKYKAGKKAMSVAEAMERMEKGEKATILAKEMGISRSTFYRRYKESVENKSEYII